jgi:hypothetical protein
VFTIGCSCSPYTAKADERSPRACLNALPSNLIEYRSSLDEVGIAGKGYHGGRERWSLWPLWWGCR